MKSSFHLLFITISISLTPLMYAMEDNIEYIEDLDDEYKVVVKEVTTSSKSIKKGKEEQEEKAVENKKKKGGLKKSDSQEIDANTKEKIITDVEINALAEQVEDIYKPRIGAVYFSPEIKDILLKLIADETQSIKIASFRFTFFPFAQALVQHTPKIPTELVVDKNYKEDFCITLKYLVTHKVKVRTIDISDEGEDKYRIMHHKFIIFDNNKMTNKTLVAMGSFNHTGNAHHLNWEEMAILDDQLTIQRFLEEFNELKALSTLCKASDCASSKGNKDTATYAHFINEVPLSLNNCDEDSYSKYLTFIAKAEPSKLIELQAALKAALKSKKEKKQQIMLQRKIEFTKRKIELAKQLAKS